MTLAALIYLAGVGLMAEGFTEYDRQRGVKTVETFAYLSIILWPLIGLFLLGIILGRAMKGEK